jgi:hypothetical protein
MPKEPIEGIIEIAEDIINGHPSGICAMNEAYKAMVAAYKEQAF